MMNSVAHFGAPLGDGKVFVPTMTSPYSNIPRSWHHLRWLERSLFPPLVTLSQRRCCVSLSAKGTSSQPSPTPSSHDTNDAGRMEVEKIDNRNGNGVAAEGGTTIATPRTSAAAASSPSSSSVPGLDWEELLSTPEPEIFGPRARSASDANVLRRKGHLKEQDKFIQFMMDMHHTHTSLEVMEKVEKWVEEHRTNPRTSRLVRMVPTLGSFFTPLRLVDAFHEYDQFFALSRRQYVAPNFAELRHILNIAQLHASAGSLKLVTFDADGTLYADGAHMQHDNEMIRLIISLMRCGVHVAIVTAAGYPNAPERFEQRVEGLLAAFRAFNLSPTVTDRFHIMGGECNYLLRVEGEDRHLGFVPDAEWKSPYMMSWEEAEIEQLLSKAEVLLLEGAERLRLPVSVIRKERAVGVVPKVPTIYEVLEDLAISVQSRLDSSLPFCAFNGGNDVFVDVGNKSLGLEALMNHLCFSPSEVLHVGDRFTDSGNDSATRDCCSILWVANPEETYFFINLMLQDIVRCFGMGDGW